MFGWSEEACRFGPNTSKVNKNDRCLHVLCIVRAVKVDGLS